MKSNTLLLLAAAVLFNLAGCGGDAVAPADTTAPTPPAPPPEPPLPPVPPIPSSLPLYGHCEKPRTGLTPNGLPYMDIQGSLDDELNWVRAMIDESYLWYAEVPAKLKAADFRNPVDFFNALKTPALTASGRPRDRFHFTYPSAVWDAMSNDGVELGYGLTWLRNSDPAQPRQWLVTLVEPGSPADLAGLRRGDRLLSVDGALIADYADAAVAARVSAGLFPAVAGASHRLLLQRRDGASLDVTLGAVKLSMAPVRNTKVLDTPAGKVGYLTFKEHNAVAEFQLARAIGELKAAGVNELVLDMRYNGGGTLTIASELAYMIAGPAATKGKVFEQLKTNDKSQPRPPQMFLAKALGFAVPQPLASGAELPYLGLKRVTVLATGATCSASESVINSLRGIDIEVNLIGAPTCGKPYAFVPAANCGTTYFAIQYQGVNHKGFGDYADGFQPTCNVADDLGHALGDPAEGLLAAALSFQRDGVCPVARARRRAAAAMQLVRPPVKEISIYTPPR
ncbi:S41 family peptidase [Rugamonas sp. CCM 8940]|uniref:S41 family peptidase n=1 Tax=Rugamonas sp. CCM 8940 TaxID=2765359 RepID=UPI00361CA956